MRREEQVAMLKNEYGAKYVLNSTAENFDSELERLTKELNCTVCLEAIAGEMTGRIL